MKIDIAITAQKIYAMLLVQKYCLLYFATSKYFH